MHNKIKHRLGIIVGEDADLPEEIIKKHGIHVYEFIVDWEQLLKKKSDIYKTMRMYSTQREKGSPKTSQPSKGYFMQTYKEMLQNYQDLIVFTISSKLSGCYNSAAQARDELPVQDQKRVHLIDTYTSAGAAALLVLDLLKNKEKKVSSLVDAVCSSIDTVKIVGLIEDPYWMQMGGRISPAIALIINQMKKIGVRPLLGTKDGKIELLKVRANAKNKAQALHSFLTAALGSNQAEVIISHADNRKDAQSLAAELQTTHQVKVVYINRLSPVLGAHLGPDSLVIGYRVHQK